MSVPSRAGGALHARQQASWRRCISTVLHATCCSLPSAGAAARLCVHAVSATMAPQAPTLQVATSRSA